MGVIRTNGIGGIEIVGLATGNDVYCTAKGIGTQINRQYTLVNLDAVGHIGWDISQIERRTEIVHRNAIDEELDLIAREAVHRQTVVGTQSAFLAYLDRGNGVENLVERRGRYILLGQIDHRDGVGLLLHAASL